MCCKVLAEELTSVGVAVGKLQELEDVDSFSKVMLLNIGVSGSRSLMEIIST